VVAGVFGMFFWAEARGLGTETARTIAVNTIVAMEVFYLFSVRYVHGTSLTLRGVVGTRAVLVGVSLVTVAQALLTYWPPLQRLFETRPIGATDLAAIVAVGVALLVVIEIEKRIVGHAAGLRRGPRGAAA
jgi:magnesium-transporting ATPase (P-type)